MNPSSQVVGTARPRVCIVTHAVPGISETFIRDHIEKLPADVTLVHGWRPIVGVRPVLPVWWRVLFKIGRLALRHDLKREITAAYARAFRKTGALAVLAEYGPNGVAALPGCRLLGLPLIVHFHGFDLSVRAVLKRYERGYQELFHHAAALIGVSHEMREKLVSLGAPAAKVHYNPYGIDCRVFSDARPAHAPPMFIAVGRFVEKKGPQITIQAFLSVHNRHPLAKLCMIGDGPLMAECRTLIESLSLSDSVRLLGAQPQSVVRDEMKRARCYVQHSLEAASGDREGTPVAILEAAATGLPVVSTLHGGIPDVVIDGKTGLLVPEHDIQGMAQAMLRMAEAPEVAGRMGQAGRARVEETFSQERSIGGLWRIIASSLGRGPA
jgi:colanic acid/amylovoran biosynthesis glycosyltransferase